MDNQELNNFRMMYSQSSDLENALEEAMKNVKVDRENSNKIMFYFGSYKTNSTNEETITYEENPKAKYKKYIDIETSEIYNVKKDEVEEFEKSHIIIRKNIVMNNVQLYNKAYLELRKQFFEQLLENTQGNAVLSLTNN